MLYRFSLAIALILPLFSISGGQETAETCNTTSLYGIVLTSIPARPVPASWVVQITAKAIGSDTTLDVEESQREMYCVKVPLFSRVFLVFERSGYEPQKTEPIHADPRRRHSLALSVIKLDPITSERGETHIRTRQDDIRARLNKHKDVLVATNSNDIFTWNLELYRSFYRDNPVILSEVESFISELKNDPQFLFFSTTEYEHKSKLFGFIIAQSQNQRIDRNVRASDITALVNDSAVFSGIRSEAINVLSSLEGLTRNEVAQARLALVKVLEQDSSAIIRTHAAEALGQLGNTDVLNALKRASKDDESREVRSAATAAAELVTVRGARIPTTVTKTVPHPDGTLTVIEYPVKKEVKVMLNPVVPIKSTGFATILRDDDGTRIVANVSDVPADVTGINLYAVDNTGAVTLLGPITVSNGVGTLTTTTPLSKFMLIASPEANLTAYDPNTKVIFRSAVPEGFAVIPHTAAAIGQTVSATTTEVTTPVASYTVPMLNIPNYKKGDDSKIKLNFSGPLIGARANVLITPRKYGPTEVNLRFHELKDAPTGKVFTVWAVSPDKKFVKLGQVVNNPRRNESEIKSEVALPDFGLLVTMEDATGPLVNPLGPSIGVVEIIKP